MTEYIVGLRLGKRSDVLTIEAEDALIAGLKVKHNHPEALISYVRKSNPPKHTRILRRVRFRHLLSTHVNRDLSFA
jgi:hypothetical protein